ncbi:hypothetical protein GPECTOR_2237g1181 [Gonium pectorale]|uniref:Uncharacterized protein n=1 Tax=Gonium pectorale TaxID=33097 RepID=A0A150FT60_GONPE|nr:hypothetical protein GPECTOR_2237g1181 [Gonium pectorale]|eukprot:KXZ40807.1 hypothetical protein GPECTOR_2237g1181 [Gonium pectorale]
MYTGTRTQRLSPRLNILKGRSMAECGRKARAVRVFVATRGSKILVDDLTAPDPKNVAKPKSTTPNFLSSQQLAERLTDIAAILQERGQELSPQDSARLALLALAKMCPQPFAVVNSYNKKVQELTAQLDAEKTRGVALTYEIEQERAKVVAAQQSEMTAKGEAAALLAAYNYKEAEYTALLEYSNYLAFTLSSITEVALGVLAPNRPTTPFTNALLGSSNFPLSIPAVTSKTFGHPTHLLAFLLDELTAMGRIVQAVPSHVRDMYTQQYPLVYTPTAGLALLGCPLPYVSNVPQPPASLHHAMQHGYSFGVAVASAAPAPNMPPPLEALVGLKQEPLEQRWLAAEEAIVAAQLEPMGQEQNETAGPIEDLRQRMQSWGLKEDA